MISGPVKMVWVTALSFAACPLTCCTSLVMASTAMSCLLVSLTVTLMSSSSGARRLFRSETALVVSLSSLASLTSTMTMTQTRTIQPVAAISPATSPAVSIRASPSYAGPERQDPIAFG